MITRPICPKCRERMCSLGKVPVGDGSKTIWQCPHCRYLAIEGREDPARIEGYESPLWRGKDSKAWSKGNPAGW